MSQAGKKSEDLQDIRRLRAFIAVALPGNVTEALGRLQAQLKQFGIRMKYTDPENIHLTLKFLGDIRPGDAGAIGERLAAVAAGFAPMELFAKGIGVFPSIRRPRVVWTGVGGHTEMLERIWQETEDAMEAMGFERENRRFTGHLTLGRFKGGGEPALLAEAIRKFGGFATDAFTADAFHLFESNLTSRGPVYRILSSHRLGVS